jgi:hypothetical protein
VIGEGSTGVNARQPQIMPGEVVGYYIAMDPLTGQRKWQVPLIPIFELLDARGFTGA